MGYGLKKLKPAWVPLLSRVYSLGLASNSLQNLQAHLFARSTNLISLDLGNNALDDLGDTLVALEPLRDTLKELKLNGNSIETLVDFPAFASLEILDLSNNRLASIGPKTFALLASLSHLYLSDNRLANVDPSSFEATTNLAVLLLGNNFLSSIPSIRTLLKLKIVDVSNQNRQLTRIRAYAFERESLPSHPMNVNLGSNDIVDFASRSFCTRNANTSEILAIDVSFESMKRFDKCLLKQLSSRVSPRIVLRVGLPVENVHEFARVCTCDLRAYAAKLRVEMSGACDLLSAAAGANKCEDKDETSFAECLNLEYACL